MTDTGEAVPETAEEKSAEKKRGCFFYGCLTAVIFLFLGLLLLFFVSKKVKEEITPVDVSKEFTPVLFTPSEAHQVLTKVTGFRHRLISGVGPQSIDLTEHEVNVAIHAHPEWSQAKDFLRVKFDEDQIGILFQVPFDERLFRFFQLPEQVTRFLKGGSISGSASIGISIDDGDIRITIEDLNLPGVPFGGIIAQQVSNQNLADRLSKKDIEELKRIDTLKVSEGSASATAK